MFAICGYVPKTKASLICIQYNVDLFVLSLNLKINNANCFYFDFAMDAQDIAFAALVRLAYMCQLLVPCDIGLFIST